MGVGQGVELRLSSRRGCSNALRYAGARQVGRESSRGSMNVKTVARSWSIVQFLVLAGAPQVDTAPSDLPPGASQRRRIPARWRHGRRIGLEGVVEVLRATPAPKGATVEDLWAGAAMTCARSESRGRRHHEVLGRQSGWRSSGAGKPRLRRSRRSSPSDPDGR